MNAPRKDMTPEEIKAFAEEVNAVSQEQYANLTLPYLRALGPHGRAALSKTMSHPEIAAINRRNGWGYNPASPHFDSSFLRTEGQ